MLKNFLKTVVLAAVVFCFCQNGIKAAESFVITVDQRSVSETVYLQGFSVQSTYLPARDLFQTLDLSFYWYQDTGTLAWQTTQGVMVLNPRLGKSYLIKEGAAQAVADSGRSLNRAGRIYITLRTLEPLGIGVAYDPVTKVRSVFLPVNINAKPALGMEEAYLLVKNEIIEELNTLPKTLGEFSTYFNESYKSRTINLTLAAQAINEAKIYPGEVFSFNNSVGPRSPERGYEKAIIFVNQEKVEAYGGGVCQVSTTLYNATLAAGLEVLERHPHSLPVPYVPVGKDATVNYGSLDYCFRNDTDYAVMIKSVVAGNKLTIELDALLYPEN